MVSHRAGLVPGVLVLLLGALALVWVSLGWRSPHVLLFDGVIVAEPYRYLHPTLGAVGGPTSEDRTQKVKPGRDEYLVAYTDESPPQAQVFADNGVVRLPPGARRMRTTITPVEPPVLPTDGHIVGNAYAIAITDGKGKPARICKDEPATLALRAPEGTDTAAIAVLDDGAWRPLRTELSGFPDLFLARITELGTFAIIAPGPPVPPTAPFPLPYPFPFPMTSPAGQPSPVGSPATSPSPSST